MVRGGKAPSPGILPPCGLSAFTPASGLRRNDPSPTAVGQSFNPTVAFSGGTGGTAGRSPDGANVVKQAGATTW